MIEQIFDIDAKRDGLKLNVPSTKFNVNNQIVVSPIVRLTVGHLMRN